MHSQQRYADIVTGDEMQDARQWLAGMVAAWRGAEPDGIGHGCSFVYHGTSSSALLGSWQVAEEHGPERDGVVLHRFTQTDGETGLAATCEIREYTQFPVIEWMLRLRNTSGRTTPVIENVRSLDSTVALGPFPYLNYLTGDYCAEDGYEPFRVSLAHEEQHRFAPMGGRPTNRAWPYHNLEWPAAARGVIAVVGWAGQWEASFRGLVGGGVRITAGQERTHFALSPGEEVRAPLSVLMFYRGERMRSQNLWRRWMFAHNMPRPGGRLPEPFAPQGSSSWFNEMTQATEENQIFFVDRLIEEGIDFDCWWMDAGWYPCDGNWPRTGTWEPDRTRFPRGLRAIADHAHAKGKKALVWFEPERVAPGTWLYEERPQWLLSFTPGEFPPGTTEAHRRWMESNRFREWKLLNLGNPEALQWLIEHVSRTISEQGIDLYRQDFNFNPLPYWRAADAEDRQGITEIRHVEGYLAYWSELRRRFPAMLIDSCASGGRRNDLETMRLSVPLHKTDYKYADLTTKQAFHHSLFQWIPFFGAPAVPLDAVDVYTVRSAFAPCMATGYDMRRHDLDFALLRRLVREWRELSGYYYGDFYPLTPYNRDQHQWIAWQFHRPAEGDGAVQAFRRGESSYGEELLKLRGLDPGAIYLLKNFDNPEASVPMSGQVLMTRGLRVVMDVAPQAAIIVYRRV